MDPIGCRWMFIEVDVWICPEENIGNQGRGAKLGGWAACREDRVLHPHYWLVHVATPGVQPLPVALAITGWLSHSCDHPQLSFSHFSWHCWSLGNTSGVSFSPRNCVLWAHHPHLTAIVCPGGQRLCYGKASLLSTTAMETGTVVRQLQE